MNGDKVFPVYAQVFTSKEFDNLDWMAYYDEFKELEERGYIREELPGISDEIRRKL
jgi:hypothetical protein